MSRNTSHEPPLKTVTILEHAAARQEASQLLLLAIVDKEPCSVAQVRNSLPSCLRVIGHCARKDFYFDLGWLETPTTILDDFSSLNWVEKHHSILTYQSTEIGRAELVDRWRRLESYLGMALDQFQRCLEMP
jgi:hypothetical protein